MKAAVSCISEEMGPSEEAASCFNINDLSIAKLTSSETPLQMDENPSQSSKPLRGQPKLPLIS